jgi:hypothetical protein
VDYSKIDLKEIGWDGMEWIDLAQNKRLVDGSCEHSDNPEFLSGYIIGSFSGRAQLRK